VQLLICAGGTGGGVNPALAVLQTMQGSADVLWVGGEGGMEAQLVERAHVPFKTIPAAGLHGVSIKSLPGNLLRLLQGYHASRRILAEFKPDVLFFTGGYLAVPMALAGMRIPSVLFVPDVEPGLALKTLSLFAKRISLTTRESGRYFSRRHRLVVTGYPVRTELSNWTRADACRSLHLEETLPTLLVVGGSRGARSINNAVIANLPALLEQMQVIHLTGELDWGTVDNLGKQAAGFHSTRYHAFPYLHDQMGAALAAADLALSRSGASTLGEYPLFGLPAILVPYPYAWRYQKGNAQLLVDHGAAVVLEDSDLKDHLISTINSLLSQPEKLAAMRAAMQQLSRPRAAAEIGRQIIALCGERSQDHG
jgi:undecaprenyldiphospho-muramoylpentapeptide beta-N-acetylglucosaminyltransferase